MIRTGSCLGVPQLRLGWGRLQEGLAGLAGRTKGVDLLLWDLPPPPHTRLLMATVALAALLFAAAVSLLSIGTMLGKRDKLKGSCAAHGRPRGGAGGPEAQGCGSCTCTPALEDEAHD